MTDIPRAKREPKVLTDEQILARRQYAAHMRAKASRMGLGPKHQLRKRVEKLLKQRAKWKHSDPNYGQKLAIAMCRIAELKRDGN